MWRQLRTLWVRYAYIGRDAALLLLAFATSMLSAPLFSLGHRNPYNISNPHNSSGFNVDNNYYAMVFVIVGTLALFLALRWLLASKYAWTIKLLMIGLILVHHFVTISIGQISGYAVGPGGLENFHSGEQLSPAYAFLHGASLYDQIFFLRGAGVDVLLPAASFKLLGQTIGSFLVASDMFMLMGLASFFALLAFLIRNPLQYAGVVVLTYVSNAMSLVQVRDVPVWLAIGLLLLIFKRGIPTWTKRIALLSIGLLTIIELIVAIDRGNLLLSLLVCLTVALIIFKSDQTNVFSWQPRQWRRPGIDVFLPVAGLLVGMAVIALALGSGSFTAFLTITFRDIPAFGGLLVSQPFPGFSGQTYLFWGPTIIAIGTSLLLLRLYQTKKPDFNRLIPYTLLLVFAILFLKAGANRIALSKLASATAPLYFAAGLIICYALIVAYTDKQRRVTLAFPIVLVLVSLATFGQFDWGKLWRSPTYSRSQLASYRQLPHTPDEQWMSPQTSQVVNYVKKHTSPNDYIFAYTSDPAYYYLTERKNPSRFYVSWFADPQLYTNELLRDLKARPPKLVIYREGSWMDQPDTISMDVRIPEVNKWILANYHTKTQLDQAIILER